MLRRATNAVRHLGLVPMLGPNAAQRARFLAGHDRERVRDLHWAFRDPDIRGILSVRGGYGTIRLLPHVDWRLIRRNPKVFVGMSDLTAFQVAALRHGLVTFAGPMPAFGRSSRFSPWAASRFWEAVGMPSHTVLIGGPPNDPPPVVLVPGVATGKLVGGNLTTLLSLIGTPWECDMRGCLVILEDVGEAPYRIDRMLTQLMLSGRLRGVVGLAMGRFHGCFAHSEQEVIDVIAERVAQLGVPAVYGLPLGHQRDVATWPQGCSAVLDADAGTLRLEEPGVL